MTPALSASEVRKTVLQVLRTIAPEADPAQVQPDIALRTQLDIDSMDALNFFIRLHQKLGVEIPEADYPKLTTLNECITYLVSKLGGSGKAAD